MQLSPRSALFPAVLATLVACGTPPTESLAVRIAADNTVVGAGQSATVTVAITNRGSEDVNVAHWFLPSNDLEEALFVVTRDGQRVAYTGAHYKRGEPQAEDFVALGAGQTMTRVVDLGARYDLTETGSYTVSYDIEALTLGNKASVSLKSNAVTLWIEGRINPELPGKPGGGGGGTPPPGLSFSGRCDATQQATLQQAFAAADTMANGSVSYLSGNPAATARYTTWFGSFSTANWAQVQGQFNAINNAFDTKAVVIDCSCQKTYYAYVYPTQPYKIYVCKAFWAAPLTGTDSKGGTLIHEMSHFDATAGTDDWVYGQSGARSLAISDPAKARNNADSHEYFAENTPALQ